MRGLRAERSQRNALRMHQKMASLRLMAAAVFLARAVFGVRTQPLNRSAGILYEVWHTPAAQLMQNVTAQHGRQLTTELVIRSNGTLNLNDVYLPYGINGDIWNVQPQLGFYCLYRRRPGDPSPPVPDCLNITQTATAHAALLSSAGFDYVSIDVTNWPMADSGGSTDVSVLRPTEVLFEEWAALRAAGTATPAIAVWPCSPANSTTWQYLLQHIYNNDTLGSLVYTQGGKKVVFLPDTPACYDADTEALIRNNFGRNDVTTIRMWALFSPQTYSQGVWGFFSPCTAAANRAAYTTSMVGEGDCEQYATTDPLSGEVVEVSASGGYMVSQGALPLASPGHMRGLTMQRLFQKVLASGAPNLFMSSFNEHIGGRQGPATGSNLGFNQGLPTDPQRASVWVDTYGVEFSRDVEPSVEGGDTVWQMAVSCVTMYKAGWNCTTAPSQLCCNGTATNVFANVWSLSATAGGDNLLTNSAYERDVLVLSGAWVERCSPIPGPSVFCVDGSVSDGRPGPFLVYNTSAALPGASDLVPLYRCIFNAPPAQHFFSTDVGCEGLDAHMEFLLGYGRATRGVEAVRGLHRCHGATAGSVIHSLDLPCDIPFPTPQGATILAFVK